MSALTNEIVRQLRADCDWCKPCAGCVKLRIAAADEMERLEREVATFEERKAVMQRACEELQMALEIEHGRYVDAASLLKRLIDDDPCQLDHHGYCQAHGLYSPPCPHAEAKKLLGEIE